ncbi:MAG: hypothetical protein QOH21_1222 [Acidobacteriota bacterium]|jgi:hypothetical protein|nr:hypothetical protein [Acidobacteriota bacterium]
MTAGRTARGMGLRLAVLLIGLLFLGFWVLSLAFKMAFAFLHFFLWIGLILAAAGAIAVLVHKIRRR